MATIAQRIAILRTRKADLAKQQNALTGALDLIDATEIALSNSRVEGLYIEITAVSRNLGREIDKVSREINLILAESHPVPEGA